ncbi:DUF6471 domain-containing protein [Pollutimonas harenae]|uniref:DUF6471 domain-containing protein n=1 Tax=Pollutimonas harenae TaxID=657015 RepID=A0A853GW98_9BURK|nr:DUF6471 domain-containing protein [Pollutimonas harenae]NYT85026.1 hypothetical protein [Pollutimonas harenae]TEA72588.1 hypothetical protein ERD84_01360 [Pollutimonas harenae]
MQERSVKPQGVLSQSQVLKAWEQEAPRLLIKEMKDRNCTYRDLAERLQVMGVYESADRLNRKVNRKTFSAAFFLMCMSALGVSELTVPTNQQIMDQYARTK